MKEFNKLADKKSIEKTILALKTNGVDAYFFETIENAKEKIFELIPKNAEIMNMTSVTLEETGISKEILESGKYNSVRKKLMSMDMKTNRSEMKKLGSAPDWTIGSVHAITEDGKIVIASNTGSQLPAYAYGGANIIFVAGSQKIVKNLDEAFERIYEYVLPLESERAKKAYGVPGSNVSKLLIINKEIEQKRITLIIINKILGF
ncbi:LUD domain protein [uncultured archaeon]|nr:LUD domain protein [uncultured archaeon]